MHEIGQGIYEFLARARLHIRRLTFGRVTLDDLDCIEVFRAEDRAFGCGYSGGLLVVSWSLTGIIAMAATRKEKNIIDFERFRREFYSDECQRETERSQSAEARQGYSSGNRSRRDVRFSPDGIERYRHIGPREKIAL